MVARMTLIQASNSIAGDMPSVHIVETEKVLHNTKSAT